MLKINADLEEARNAFMAVAGKEEFTRIMGFLPDRYNTYSMEHEIKLWELLRNLAIYGYDTQKIKESYDVIRIWHFIQCAK